MADTVTVNFGWIKPEIGASSTTWGDKTNGNWDSVDALMFSMKAVTDIANTPAREHAATNKPTPVDADEFAGLDSASTPTAFGLVKFTWSQIKAYVLAYFNATAKNPPVDADRVWFGDSAASNVPKYATWTQIKAYLKTYFDTLYEPSFATLAWSLITGTPTTVAGYGITDVHAADIGIGQGWVSYTVGAGNQRWFNVTYQNTTPKPIMVSVSGDAQGANMPLQVSTDNVTWVTAGTFAENGTDYQNVSIIVPAGSYYKVNGSVNINSWCELR